MKWVFRHGTKCLWVPHTEEGNGDFISRGHVQNNYTTPIGGETVSRKNGTILAVLNNIMLAQPNMDFWWDNVGHIFKEYNYTKDHPYTGVTINCGGHLDWVITRLTAYLVRRQGGPLRHIVYLATESLTDRRATWDIKITASSHKIQINL